MSISKNDNNSSMTVRFKKLYDELFTDEEKKHIQIVVNNNHADFIGREDLKQRLMNAIFKR